ncbi:efflux pump antibiotic resistance protein [Aspergillus nomiae NRRL 13137]|uniref:Efflux pump antibiotic resistance protein n=1 Tax=Aspergillus nomiae NRRL (strain ATCC 15546 / NRRL 13137 / CBS 260.88 / M93) TaxID=1509407 RepID=A0A0L1JI08_ASPN3|nr:efflux pump antibiotic resistance protein [Aspergillus nomiae NRRL 13137]KNG91013.1 efflux pump antibiotic resistance protein [Aspergillus nomiae NRRL 13137]
MFSSPGDPKVSTPPTTATSRGESDCPLHESKEVNHSNPDSSSGPVEQYIDGLLLHVIVLCLAVAMFLVSLDTTIISTAIPLITDEFNSTADVGWYGAAFLLGSAVTQAPWGKLYGFFNIKWTYLLSLLTFELGSLLCALSHNSPTLIIGRAIAGVGGSGIGSGIYTIIGVCVPPRRRPMLIGITGLAFLLASFAGPVIGGEFASHVSWRWCFWINLPIGGATFAAILCFFRTPSVPTNKKASWKEIIFQLDPLGMVTLTGALLCFLLGLEWGISKSWHNPDVIGCLVGFPLLMGLFIANEFFWNDRAMIPRRLLLKREVTINLAFIFLVAGAFFTLLYYMPIYFQAVKGNSAEESGIRTLPLIVSAGVMAVIGAIGLGITGYPTPFLLAGGILISVGAGLLYTLDLPSPPRLWIPYQILAGLGIGTSLQVPIIMNQATVDAPDMSTMTSMTLFFKCLGASIFMQTGQTIFLDKVKRNLEMTSVADVNPNQLLAGGLLTGQHLDSESSLAIGAAYVEGLKYVFVLVVALSGLATLLALLVGRYKMDTARLRL